MSRDDSTLFEKLCSLVCGTPRRRVQAVDRNDTSPRYSGPPNIHCPWCDFPLEHTENAHRYHLKKYAFMMSTLAGIGT